MFSRAVHPGDVLKDELGELNLSVSELARQIGVPANRLSQIIRGRRAVTGDTALRLGHWFGMSPQFWMNLQAGYDLAQARAAVGAALDQLPVRAA
jgi:antitoxin HigA-1